MTTGPTLEQKTKIDRVVDLFDRDWEAVIVPHPEIRRKPRSMFRRIRDCISPRKHNVFALYWWLKKQYLQDKDLPKTEFPLKHDNMPMPGYPMKYEMQGDWKIRREDLKFLKAGPLGSKGLKEILVPHDIGWARFRRIISENRVVLGLGLTIIVEIPIQIWIEKTF